MPNMSYCRFTNTRSDLEDCLDAIRQDQKLSDVEARSGKNLFRDFLSFCCELDLIEGFDGEAVDELFRSLTEHEDAK